jgi:hypothetical protein
MRRAAILLAVQECCIRVLSVFCVTQSRMATIIAAGDVQRIYCHGAIQLACAIDKPQAEIIHVFGVLRIAASMPFLTHTQSHVVPTHQRGYT